MFRAFFFLAILTGALWLAGLHEFVKSVEAIEVRPAADAATDAIVVLTGGSERLNTGFELLEAHKSKKLFISGVHPGLTLDRLIGNQKVAKDLRDCCIKLGFDADSTFGNAWETRTWMEAEGYHTLRLVTANYHMPRSLLVFHAVMPEFGIVPHPVMPDGVRLDDWWKHFGTASLLTTEYNKYLLAHVRLWIGSA